MIAPSTISNRHPGASRDPVLRAQSGERMGPGFRRDDGHCGRLPDDRSDPLHPRRRPRSSAEPGETIWQVADRQGIEIPHLCWLPKPGYRADGNCRACMVEIEGERVLAASCVRKPAAGMKVQTASERARFSRKMVFELLVGDQPVAGRGARPQFALLAMGRQARGQRQPLPAARAAGARPQPSGDGGAARRLHPVQSLRPRLPRGPGQRRDRHGGARPPRKDHLRFRRPDGQQHLRRLRRMRAGLPDRRADAGDPGRRERRLRQRARPRGRQRLPLLRGRLPADLQDPRRPHRRGRGQGRAGQPQPALRQGPLRLRLRRTTRTG